MWKNAGVASVYKHWEMRCNFSFIVKVFCTLILGTCMSSFVLAQNAGKQNSHRLSKQNKSDETFVCLSPFPATFPGGLIAWKKYLLKKINYPEIAQQHKTEGIVRISMTIQKNGSVTDVYALTEAKDSLNEEAIRVIKSSPKWNPAIENGHPAIYRFVQNFTFQLEDEEPVKTVKSPVKRKTTELRKAWAFVHLKTLPAKTDKPITVTEIPPDKINILLLKEPVEHVVIVIKIPIS